MWSVACNNDNSACLHFLVMSLYPYFHFISGLFLSDQLKNCDFYLVGLYYRATLNVLCKDEDSVILYFLFSSPDQYILVHAAIGKAGFHGISMFFVFLSDKVLQCSVCMDDFKLKEEVRKLPCDHHFHTDCIVPWLKMVGDLNTEVI